MTQIHMIPVDLIDPHPYNPRRDLGDLTELADSIKAHGIRQNLLLAPHPDAFNTSCQHPADDHDIDDGTCCVDTDPACSCAGLVLAEAGA